MEGERRMLTREMHIIYKYSSPSDKFEILTEEILEALSKVDSAEDRKIFISTVISSMLTRYCECGRKTSEQHECDI